MKTPQNCKSPTQRQRFMTTMKNVTEEKEKKAQKLNWIYQSLIHDAANGIFQKLRPPFKLFQPQRMVMTKNVQTTTQLHSFTCQQGNVQNPSRQTSIVHELRTSRCTSWLQKRQKNQRSNCQHSLDHRKSKGIAEKHLLLLN